MGKSEIERRQRAGEGGGWGDRGRETIDRSGGVAGLVQVPDRLMSGGVEGMGGGGAGES